MMITSFSLTSRASSIRILSSLVKRHVAFSVEMFTVVGCFVCSLQVFFWLRLLAGWLSGELRGFSCLVNIFQREISFLASAEDKVAFAGWLFYFGVFDLVDLQ
jgi:hypothetical protein